MELSPEDLAIALSSSKNVTNFLLAKNKEDEKVRNRIETLKKKLAVCLAAHHSKALAGNSTFDYYTAQENERKSKLEELDETFTFKEEALLLERDRDMEEINKKRDAAIAALNAKREQEIEAINRRRDAEIAALNARREQELLSVSQKMDAKLDKLETEKAAIIRKDTAYLKYLEDQKQILTKSLSEPKSDQYINMKAELQILEQQHLKLSIDIQHLNTLEEAVRIKEKAKKAAQEAEAEAFEKRQKELLA